MQEALKNTHYKKIWEKVIMNRHQDCDNIEKALLHESTHKGCLIALDDKPYHVLSLDDGLIEYDFMRPQIAKLIHIEDPEGDDVQCKVCDNFVGAEEYPSYIAKINKVKFFNPQILGRQIMFGDIIDLFTKQEINKGAGDVEICIFTPGQLANLYNISITGHVETGEKPQYHYVGDFLYSITKPLHEQTPEAWEKIANLID